MTMAPGRKKRAYWLEIIFISILLFLLMGSRSQNTRTATHAELQLPLHQALVGPSLTMK
jgi:hypothetical protein